MVFQFTDDSAARYKGFDAQAIGESLEQLRAQLGGDLQDRPHLVVEAARDPQSPLHGVFTWDDAKAAESFRVLQARALVRAVVVVRDAVLPCERAVVQAPPATPTAFGRVQAPAVDQLAEAYQDLKAWRRKYAGVEALYELFAAIDETLPRLKAAS